MPRTRETRTAHRELLAAWGFRATGSLLPLTFRGALQSEDGTVTAVAASMRGWIREIDYDTWKPGAKVPLNGITTGVIGPLMSSVTVIVPVIGSLT